MVNIEKEKKAQNANVSHRPAENPNATARGLSHSSVNIGTIDPLYFLLISSNIFCLRLTEVL
jgi:hypothetical protein